MTRWKVPGYTQRRRIGGSGSGEVVLARHKATRRPVAIKYLRGDLLADPEFARLFRAEAAPLAELNDAHVTRLFEYVESEYGAAIVTELVDGVCLREILASQDCLLPEAALVVLRGSLIGLSAAHRHGLVHRDYKPANVLVSGNGDSKLTDFGLAVRGGELPVADETLRYAAPEQLDGYPATPASDVYAATATFYECVTGGPPFSRTTEEMWRLHQYEPVPLELVPAALRPLVVAGMAQDPRQRPADAMSLVSSIQRIASATYGRDWAMRGRAQLSEAALALSASWPLGKPAAESGFGGYRVQLGRSGGELRLNRRQARVAKAAAAVAAAGTIAAGAIALATTGNARAGPPVTVVHTVSLQAPPSPALARTAPSRPAGSRQAGSRPAGSRQAGSRSQHVGRPQTHVAARLPSAAATTPSAFASPSRSVSPSPSASPSASPSPSPSGSPSGSSSGSSSGSPSGSASPSAPASASGSPAASAH